MEDAYRFAPAAPEEESVYGAACPGWHTAADHATAVTAWVEWMRDHGIERVCCLLTGMDEGGCQVNMAQYTDAFGAENVIHAPIPDRRLVDRSVLEETILPFLSESARMERPVVVHGLSGLGRTGQVLAAWLVYGRGYDPETALETVRQMGRCPIDDTAVDPTGEDALVSRLVTIG